MNLESGDIGDLLSVQSASHSVKTSMAPRSGLSLILPTSVLRSYLVGPGRPGAVQICPSNTARLLILGLPAASASATVEGLP